MAVTILKPGQRMMVLDNADLTAGDPTLPFTLAPGYNGEALITVVNLTDTDVIMSVSVDGIDFFDVTDALQNSLKCAAQTATVFQLSCGFTYALAGVENITAQSIWVGR